MLTARMWVWELLIRYSGSIHLVWNCSFNLHKALIDNKMKKILLYMILCATVGLVSCGDEYLDRLPQTKIPETQDFFNTETGLKSFSDGFYRYFSTGVIRGDEGNSDNAEHTG